MKKFEEDLLLLEDQNAKLSKVGARDTPKQDAVDGLLLGCWPSELGVMVRMCCPVGMACQVVHKSSLGLLCAGGLMLSDERLGGDLGPGPRVEKRKG